VPDVYQGSELWDLSLVDPDNRRQVDFELRRKLLSEVDEVEPERVMARADEGAPKLWLVSRLLRARRDRPELFSGSGYAPVAARGAKARHAVSFVRDRLLVVVPRMLFGLNGDWVDTTIDLPEGRWNDLLTGRSVDGGTAVALGSLLAAFPVAILARNTA
jgi:(1->4)-alpha-D-glucan 1-alpha-D-glucosylmutase